MVSLLTQSRILTLFAAFFCVIFSFWVFGPSLSNRISPIDDHELVYHLNGKSRINFGNAISLWTRDLSGTGRFRPAYNFLRILELFAWGDNLILWYATRLSIFAFSMTTCWFILAKLIHPVISGMISIWFFSHAFWADIFGRLGPSESYAVLGVTLFVLGSFYVLTSNISKVWVGWILLFLGFGLAVFSKENMIVLFIPLLGVIHLSWKNKSNRPFSILALLFGILSVLSIGTFLITLSTHVGVDVYGNAIDDSRVQLLFSVMRQKPFILSIIALFITGILHRSVPGPIWKQRFLNLWWIMLSSAALIASQYVFYNGDWPTNIRYDFPGVLYKLLLLLLGTIFFHQFVIKRLERNSLRIAQVVVSLLLLFILFSRLQFPILQERVVAYGQLTHSYSQGLDLLYAESLQKDVIIESTSVNDMEILHAIQVSLRANSKQISLYLRLHRLDYEQLGEYTGFLYESLEKTQDQGNDLITPLNKRNTTRPCISFFLHTQVASDCQVGPVMAVTW